jgi:hypothetical protein
LEIFSWLLFAGLLAIGFVGRELDREDVGNYLIVSGLGLFFAYCFHAPEPLVVWQGWTLILNIVLLLRLQGYFEVLPDPLPHKWAAPVHYQWKPMAKRTPFP